MRTSVTAVLLCDMHDSLRFNLISF